MTLAGLILLLTVLGNGLADLPGLLDLGPFSVMGLLTLVYAAASWLLLVVRFRSTRAAAGVAVPFVLFLVWGVSTYYWRETESFSTQNLVVVAAFIGLVLLGARESYDSPRLAWRIGRALATATLVAGALYAASVVRAGPGNDILLGARSFGLFGLLGLAWFLAGWRYGSRIGLWVAVGLLVVVGLSLSRLALVSGALLFPLALVRSGRLTPGVRAIVCTVVAASILAWAITSFEPLRARFFEGDLSFGSGEHLINASGRTRFWEITLASFWESPWIGKGAGSAAKAVVETTSVRVGHPHSDYLRLLHDYGILGSALWMFGFWRLFRTTWGAWRRADHAGDAEARLHLAAFLALVAVALGMTTDNAMVYIFVMAPFAVLVGASLGRTRVGSARQPACLPNAEPGTRPLAYPSGGGPVGAAPR